MRQIEINEFLMLRLLHVISTPSSFVRGIRSIFNSRSLARDFRSKELWPEPCRIRKKYIEYIDNYGTVEKGMILGDKNIE